MRLRRNYLKIIAGMVSIGATGASLLLGSTLPAMSAERPTASSHPPVSQRLAAIREAVFNVIVPEDTSKSSDPGVQLVWGNRWNNWGWRRPGWGWGPPWGNWRNFRPPWNNFWRNW
jgi:hypothetical protein